MAFLSISNPEICNLSANSLCEIFNCLRNLDTLFPHALFFPSSVLLINIVPLLLIECIDINYPVLLEAEERFVEIIKKNGGSGDNDKDNDYNKSDNNPTTNNNSDANLTGTSEESYSVITPSNTTEQTVDNVVSFNIKNKKTYKKSKKVTIKDSDGIKSIKLNGKTIKVKSGKKSFSWKQENNTI